MAQISVPIDQAAYSSDLARSTFTSELDRLDNLIAEIRALADRACENANRLGGSPPSPAAADPLVDPHRPEPMPPHLVRLQQGNDHIEAAIQMASYQIERSRETIG